MTEADWMSGADVFGMLEQVGTDAGARKLRLFACTCCRHVWDALAGSGGQAVVETMEAEADRPGAEFLADAEVALRGARGTARRAIRPRARDSSTVRWRAIEVVLFAAEGVTIAPANSPLSKPVGDLHDDFDALGGRVVAQGRLGKPNAAALGAVCALARDIFGNPFRPVAFAPQWRTDTAVALARQMYESRDFAATPILADALQDAGCDAAEVLAHLRDTTATHVRGCWVCDLVLDKE